LLLKISIITAVRNGERAIGDCIKSFNQQTCPAEHVIIDGQSTDGSIEIINKLRTSDSIFLSEPDRGFYDALNKGIGMASGDVIGILNADDVYANDRVLEKVADCFAGGLVESCYGDLVYLDAIETGQVRRYWYSGPYHERRFYQGWMPPHPTFFVRRKVYEKHGGFNLELGTAADYELMLRFLVRYKITTYYIPEVLVKMRMGGQSNASLRKRLAANRMDRKAWAVNGLKPYPWTLLLKPLSKIGQFF
jgi:glycosyltransferase involved in cell wall biosynthesis